ncbi:MAG: nitrilase-related carbon-nitrogen hydrolase [Bacteroidales bacterium]
MNTTIVNAGFLQFNPLLGQPNENIKNIALLIDEAMHANLLVIPELANSGYNFESKEQALQLAVTDNKSNYLNLLQEKASQHNMFIVSGFLEREDDKLFNSSILVGPNGILGKYRKIHLFWNEFDFFERGNLGLPVFDLGFCKIGMLICFDWIFPEVWRILAIKGADIICHPSNLVLPYAQQAVPVQGMINRTFNITANRFGTEREVTFSGKSFISDPFGKTLVSASPDEDEIGIAKLDISKARNKMITPRNHAFNDRIPEEYTEILN